MNMHMLHNILVLIALANYAFAQSDDLPSDDVLNEMLGGSDPPVVAGDDNTEMISPPTPPPALIPSTTEGPIIDEVVTNGPIPASAITTKAIKALIKPAKNITLKEVKKNNWLKKKITKDPEQGLHEIFEHIFTEKKYDKKIRPKFQREPLVVKVQVLVNSFGPIIETSMDYKMDIFLRSSWTDKRLAYAGDVFNIKNLNLDPSMIYNIWRPDIFFANAKKADFHKVTRDNNMLQLFPDGSLTQSIRISLTLDCPMNLKFFPLDEQVCAVYLESFAFPTTDLLFEWHTDKAAFILPENQMSTAQVRIVNYTLGDCTKVYPDTGNFTCVVAKIHLKREIGYYMIGTFIPTILIVVLSWISFWINPLAAPARVALGITTVLTMTTKASSIRAGLPKVSYVKAIDVWMLGCLLFVFTALLQYAYVNFIIRLKRHYAFVCKTCADEKDPDKLEEIRKSNFSIAKRYDVICRGLFPLAFIIFNITFWAYYLNTNSLDYQCYEEGGCILF